MDCCFLRYRSVSLCIVIVKGFIFSALFVLCCLYVYFRFLGVGTMVVGTFVLLLSFFSFSVCLDPLCCSGLF